MLPPPGVDVAVAAAVFVNVGVGGGVPEPDVVTRSVQPPLMLPTSTPSSSRTYSDHVPFGEKPLNADNAAPPPGTGAGAGKLSSDPT